MSTYAVIGLQKLEQQPLEADEASSSRRAASTSAAAARAASCVRRDVAIDVIDEGGVETLLGVERRPDHAPDEAAQPALERAIGGRRRSGQDLPAVIQTLDLAGVVEHRRRRELGAPAVERPIERGQRVVVLPIGGLPLAVEPLEKIGEPCVRDPLVRRLRLRPSGRRRFASERRRG